MERPSRSKIFRSKMQVEKEKRENTVKENKQQLPVHKRSLGSKEQETR